MRAIVGYRADHFLNRDVAKHSVEAENAIHVSHDYLFFCVGVSWIISDWKELGNLMQEIDKLAWLHIEDKKVLGARSKGKTVIYLPGGKREPGESDEAALTREIREELSVELIPATIKYVDTFIAQADGKPDGVMVRMACYQAEFRGMIKPGAEIEEVIWISYRDRDKCSIGGKIILDWLKEKGMIA
jgi:8-oxo-dGTP diphosphatase